MRIGLDLGGTKIAGALFGADGAVLAHARTPTPRRDYQATLRTLVDVVHDLERRAGARGSVGIGTPGSPSRVTGLLRNANSTCLNGRPFQADFERLLGRSVRVANDANCFALSEAVDGAGAGARVVFGVILGTGCGGGVVVDGSVLEGKNGIAGEWGHNPFPFAAGGGDGDPPRDTCYCGRVGCIETVLCGPALARDHHRATGIDLTAEQVADAAVNGDAAAGATVERYARRLARALATVINVLDPDMIVLGGGVSNIDALYRLVPEAFAPHVFSDRIDTRLARNAWGDDGGTRGAAWLWPPPA